jgi:hypothetical protein
MRIGRLLLTVIVDHACTDDESCGPMNTGARLSAFDRYRLVTFKNEEDPIMGVSVRMAFPLASKSRN